MYSRASSTCGSARVLSSSIAASNISLARARSPLAASARPSASASANFVGIGCVSATGAAGGVTCATGAVGASAGAGAGAGVAGISSLGTIDDTVGVVEDVSRSPPHADADKQTANRTADSLAFMVVPFVDAGWPGATASLVPCEDTCGHGDLYDGVGRRTRPRVNSDAGVSLDLHRAVELAARHRV